HGAPEEGLLRIELESSIKQPLALSLRGVIDRLRCGVYPVGAGTLRELHPCRSQILPRSILEALDEFITPPSELLRKELLNRCREPSFIRQQNSIVHKRELLHE